MKGTLVVDMETVTICIHNFCDSFSVLSIENTQYFNPLIALKDIFYSGPHIKKKIFSHSGVNTLL